MRTGQQISLISLLIMRGFNVDVWFCVCERDRDRERELRSVTVTIMIEFMF